MAAFHQFLGPLWVDSVEKLGIWFDSKFHLTPVQSRMSLGRCAHVRQEDRG